MTATIGHPYNANMVEDDKAHQGSLSLWFAKPSREAAPVKLRRDRTAQETVAAVEKAMRERASKLRRPVAHAARSARPNR